MPRVIGSLALLVLLVGFSGCGDNTNKPPENAATPEYGEESKNKMAAMYGAPKAEKAKSNNAADIMKSMYNK